VEGCSQREVQWRALRAATRSKSYFWLPVDHNRHQILSKVLLNSFIPYIVRRHVFLTSARKALPPLSNRRNWVNLGPKDSVELEVEINWRFRGLDSRVLNATIFQLTIYTVERIAPLPGFTKNHLAAIERACSTVCFLLWLSVDCVLSWVHSSWHAHWHRAISNACNSRQPITTCFKHRCGPPAMYKNDS
jgi:hypothetical protein